MNSEISLFGWYFFFFFVLIGIKFLASMMYHNASYAKEIFQLFQFYRRKHKGNTWAAFLEILNVTCQLGYYALYYACTHPLESQGKGKFILTYPLYGKLWKIIVYAPYGPSCSSKDIIQIIDENHEDVTEKIIPFVGPKHDFHGCVYTPSTFGYRQLTFNLSDSDCLCFERDERIVF